MDPLEEAPWADTPQSTPAAHEEGSAAAPSSGADKPSADTTSSAPASSGGRPARAAPRRLVAQPTRLQAVEDDPLGPLGALSSSTSTLFGADVSTEPAATGLESPPAPPLKELPLRSTMPAGAGSSSLRGPADPHRIDIDDLDGGGTGGLFDGQSARGARVPPPVAASVPTPMRTTSRPSVTIEQASKPSFYISVGDPHKIGGATGSHIEYSVKTQTTSKAYRQPEFVVNRRYRDFLWLYSQMHANCPGVVVPPPPEKQAMGRFESNFQDGDLKLFLESEAFNVDVKHKERKEPNLGESKGIMSSLGLSVGGGVKFVEQDDWFHERRIYLDALEIQLKSLLKAMDSMVTQRKSMADAAADFSASLHALSTVELSPSLSGPLEALSDLQATIRDVYDRQAQQDILTFGITIDEYIRLIGSVKQAFSQRQKAFYSWHSADAELQKRKTAQDKLLRQGKSQQDRLNQIGADVADAERKVHQARLLFEDMGRLMHNELDRFEREKVEDFKSGVETFLESSVEAQKELIEKWETFLMQLDAEDDETAFYRPPVLQSASRPAGDTAIDRARAHIDEDSD
ncbi:vacuolar protein sorting-associated protein [Grosmannia clavigera kw1407]|uniref:Vacuolar protein sorting-associated protein n=1 Tax=Grosmannia clavigera (strain kw1407 / UAMH 11150) TaxID=655863 RepID=F0XMF1_GROCL|nr:vacuolar protein sorting-associated protein [Grosmannia clavigera kw1407]EFX01068.1 vacuolar protein sorting-associated protein [Grosmannia clavigera kw1407]